MNLQRWRGVPVQLFIFTVLPLSLLLLLIAIGSLLLHQQAMRTLVGTRDERAVRAASAAITEQIDHRLTVVSSLARQAVNSGLPEHILADAAYFSPNFDAGLALFGADGTLLAASDDLALWQSAYLANQLQEAIAAKAFAQNHWFVATLIHPVTQMPLTLAVSAGENGLIAAGAFSAVGLADRALDDLLAGGEVTAFILDANGRLLYHAGLRRGSPDNLVQYPGVAEAWAGESGTTYLDLENEEYVVAFSAVPIVNWALIIEEPWRTVADPLLAATEYMPLVLAPALIIAVVALWFGVRQIVRPLQLLEQKASALGGGDFEAINEPVGGVAEIHRLQIELMQMAQKVQAAQQGLRGYLGAITTGQEEERQRLARDLHDETIQSLIVLNQRVQMAQMLENGRFPTEQLIEMQTMITQIIADLRRLSRDLRPIYLEDLGLIPALDILVRDAQNGTGIDILFHTVGARCRLLPPVELALYRIVQEALSNIKRHARATQAAVHLNFSPDRIILTVQDNGCGFTVPDSPAEMTAIGHFGLLGVRERTELIGGQLTITSIPNLATTLTVVLPSSTLFTKERPCGAAATNK